MLKSKKSLMFLIILLRGKDALVVLPTWFSKEFNLSKFLLVKEMDGRSIGYSS